MFDELRAANLAYAATFDLGGLPGRAARGLALVTCIDTRIDPLAALGLRPGDAKILRNAGGRVTDDVLRSLVLATSLLGVTHIVVMHHTDCALAGRTEEQLRSALADRQLAAAAAWDFLAMPDPDVALAHDVANVRRCSALPGGLAVEGWRYDVDTGLVQQIVPGAFAAGG
ncbi:MAG TPA: carbonic anhydrase [Acidimicrobiales bacterium]|nr:carbonic anhydrase [Acidimicrobiales bacterium]